MKDPIRMIFLSAMVVAFTGPAALSGQLPEPASPMDGVMTDVPAPQATAPVATLVESILAGEDDPAVWARLEEALGSAAAEADPQPVSATAGPVATWLGSIRSPSTWSLEDIVLAVAFGLLGVAGAGAGVGALRRRRVSGPLRIPHRSGISVAGRRRRTRGKGATCRDAARLQARLRHRRAA